MWSLLPLLCVPLVVMVVVRFMNPCRFTVKEFLLLEGIMVPLLIGGFFAARWGALQDVEFWNGYITGKPSGSQKCCHCRQECDTCTRTVSNGNGGTRTETYRCNCREVCSHTRDYWWSLDVSTGDRISVASCEPSSRRVPRIWSEAQIGDPAAVPHRYTNYLLADPDSVLLQSADETKRRAVPKYPQIYDLYKVDRAVNAGTLMPVRTWNKALMELNADIGKSKQVNVVVVATADSSPTYAEAIQSEWLYGRKNDVIFVLGAPDGQNIEWARVVSISRVEMLKAVAKDDLPGGDLTEVDMMVAQIRALVLEHYTRTPMAEFEYLGVAAQPPGWALALLYVLAFAGAGIGSTIMVEVDVFKEERYGRYRRW